MLYGKDRGCSFPGCHVPGYFCEVHHVTDFATCWTSNIDDLTFGCGNITPWSNPAAGAPANSPTATPNGCPRRISTTANPAPTPTIIRKNCYATTTKTSRSTITTKYLAVLVVYGYYSVARMQTVMYGSATPLLFASAGWVASNSRTRSSVLVRTSAGEVMQ
jgi:hypothetical protein